MARATGITGSLILPNASEKYDAQNERETRRLIALAMSRLTRWDAISDTPSPVVALGALTGAADMVPYFSGISTMVLTSLTAYARTIIACANAAAARTVLGLGPLAILASPSDATKFLNGAVSPAFALVKDSDLSLSNITTNDVSITKHGFTPIAPNDTSKFLRGDGSWATPAGASYPGNLPVFPTLSGTIQLRLSAEPTISTLTKNTDGLLAQWNDTSGNWGSNFTATTTARPRWMKRAMMCGRPGVVFDGSTSKMVAGAIKTLAQPFTAIVVLQDWGTGSVNSNIYRDSNLGPVFFLSGSSWALFAGTGLTSAGMFTQNRQAIPRGHIGAAAVSIQVYNGASSILSNNGVEATGAGGATSITGTMRIGGDASTSFADVIIYEILFVSGAMSPTDRAAINLYYATALEIDL